MTKDEYFAVASERFGADMLNWRFVCPVCKHVQSVADYKAAGAPESAVAFSCVGRWISGSKEAFSKNKSGPCTYAGGGLFRLNPVVIDGEDVRYFDIATPDQEAKESE